MSQHGEEDRDDVTVVHSNCATDRRPSRPMECEVKAFDAMLVQPRDNPETPTCESHMLSGDDAMYENDHPCDIFGREISGNLSVCK